MADINEMLKKTHKTLSELQLKLGELNQVHDDIVQLKNAAINGKELYLELPMEFQKKFDEIKNLSNQYLSIIDSATNKYFEVNNKVYIDNQKLFSSNTEKFSSKIVELTNVLADLKTFVNLLQDVNLERHFVVLNGKISTALENIQKLKEITQENTQNITNTREALGVLKTTVNTNHKQTLDNLENFGKKIENSTEVLELKVKSLIEKTELLTQQNDLLFKTIKTNRTYQIIGLAASVSTIIFLIIKLKF